MALVFAAPAAHANGRFPGAIQLVIRGQDAVMTSSFGVITSRDAFSSSSAAWICESSLGYDPAQQNELGAAIFDDGAFAFSGPQGLTISRDRGCSNERQTGLLQDRWMSDVSRDLSSANSAVAISRSLQSGECAGQVYETRDNGRTWTLLSELPKEFCAFTIDTPASDPNRIYVSGNNVAADGKTLIGQLLVSDDRGVTWSAHDIPGEARPFIGALAPLDRDTVYIRTSNPPSSGSLLVTNDGGKTFRTIARLTGVPLQFFGVTGLAVSPDGSRLAYGSVNEGLFVVDAKGGEPEKRSEMPVMCLTWTGESLFACSAPSLCGPFFLGRSSDEGRTFTTILATGDVNGDRTECPANTPTQTLCPSQWPSTKKRLGTCQSGMDASADDGGAPDAGPPAPPSLDCDCETTARNGGGGSALGAIVTVAAAALAGLRRRITRRRS